MPVCPTCHRPPPEPAQEGDLALDLGGDLRPLLADLRGRQVVPLDEARGEERLREAMCPGCGRLVD